MWCGNLFKALYGLLRAYFGFVRLNTTEVPRYGSLPSIVSRSFPMPSGPKNEAIVNVLAAVRPLT